MGLGLSLTIPRGGLDAATVAWATTAATNAGGTAVPSSWVAIAEWAIRRAKSSTLWSKLGRLNLCIGSVAAHAATPQKSVNTQTGASHGNAQDTQVSSPSYATASGWTFNGTSYLRTGWTPSTALASSLSSHLAVLVTHGMTNGANRTLLGASSNAGANRFVHRWLNTNAVQCTLGGGAMSISFSNEVPDGVLVGSYRGANDGRYVRNRNTVATLTGLTDARPIVEVAIGGWWSGASISEGNSCAISSYSMGLGLTDAEQAELAYIMDRVHQLAGRERRVAAWGDSMTAAGSSDWLAQYRAALATPYVTTQNGGVGGETSSQVLTRFNAAPHFHGYNTTIWVGRNGYLSGIAQVKSDIAAMVAALGHTRYRVFQVLPRNDGLENTGSANRILLNQLNTDLAATYGARFVSLLAALQNDDGIAWAGQDATDVGNGLIPTSRLVDTTHLTTGSALDVNGRRTGNRVVREAFDASIAGGW